PSPPAGRIAFTVPAPLHARLHELGLQAGATLFMTLQAGLAALYTRLGAGEDIVLGTAIAGRTETALREPVGFLGNTLVLRLDTGGDPTFRELLARARATCLGAYAHPSLPFERLVEILDPPRVLGRQPLFQTMLVLHNTAQPALRLQGLAVEMLAAAPA